MNKLFLVSSLLLLGFGCNQKPPLNNQVDLNENPQNSNSQNAEVTSTSSIKIPTTTEAVPKKLAVEKSFTLEEIEAQGGLKNWFRDLARANVAGKKTLVRVPVNRVFGFGCVTPTQFCVSTETTGCFGPFVDLKGDFDTIKKVSNQCEAVCNAANDARCTQEFRNNQCSTLWEVEGYVVAASRLPEAKDDGTPGTCADGELAYDFEVTRVIQKIAGGVNDEFLFYEYK